MKTTSFILLTGLALVSAASAGTPATATPPPASVGLWEWFAGGSIGYITDINEAMYGLQVGVEYKAPGTRATQAIYLEVGFTHDGANYMYSPPPGVTGGRTENAAIDLDIIPLTLNYKFEAPITERLHYYLGLGLGIVFLDSSYDWSWSQAVTPPNNQGVGGDDRTEVRFYGDVFAGLSYTLSDSLRVFAGVRYIFMDDVNRHIDVTQVADYTAGINNDVLFELGMRYSF